MVLTENNSTQTVTARIQRSVYFVPEGGLYKLSFHAMSTLCRVNFQAESPPMAQSFANEVVQWAGWFEARYSRFIKDSLISRINGAAGKEWVEIDPETEALFDLCQEMIFLKARIELRQQSARAQELQDKLDQIKALEKSLQQRNTPPQTP